MKPDGNLADNYYGELLLFVLDTMIANRNRALSDDDVAYFTEVRREIEPQWLRGLRLMEVVLGIESGDAPRRARAWGCRGKGRKMARTRPAARKHATLQNARIGTLHARRGACLVSPLRIYRGVRRTRCCTRW